MNENMNLMPEICVVAAMIFRKNDSTGSFLIAKRRTPPLWEFPGGKVEENERPEDALYREIKEELDCMISVHCWIGQSTVMVQNRRITMDLFQCFLEEGEPTPLEHLDLRWIGVAELNDFDWAPADIPLLEDIRTFLRG